jgi:two-component system, OmpR family, sensor kinase
MRARLPAPRSIRGRLFVTVVVAVALALAAMIAGFNLLLQHELSRNADQLVRARAAAELALVRTHHGRIAVGETADDAAVDSKAWVFSGGRALEAPQSGATLAAAARALAARAPAGAELGRSDARLWAVPIVSHGRRLGTVVAATSLAPYEQTQRTALIASLALGALLLLVVAVSVRWLLVASLRPVARMTRQASDWSEHDLDRRFGLGEPYDEVTELAATLDQLLERLAAGFRREQRFSTELSHELRTPLARVIARAEVALRQERAPGDYSKALGDILRDAQQVSRTIDALVAAARHDSALTRGTADAYGVSQRTVEAAAELAGQRKLELAVDSPSRGLRLGVDPDLAERILQPVVDNACRYGRRHVRVRLARDASFVVYVVEDDGPGISPGERESIFEPGVRGAAGRAPNGSGGAGLGLALARRLARSASGDVDVEPGGDGGRFVVSLPAA